MANWNILSTTFKRARWIVLAIACVVFGIVLAWFGVMRHHPIHRKPNAVSIDYVSIPTGANETRLYPADGAETAAGHYAYIDTSGFAVNPYINLGGKLEYDGRTVYKGNDLELNYVISQNGLHYAYMRYGNDGTEIYVDNKPVKTLLGQTESTVTLWAVSNDGGQYAYSDVGLKGNMLYRNDNLLYSGTAVQLADFSSDLSHYAAIVQAGSIENLIRDGRNFGRGSAAYVSPNGVHVIALANGAEGLSNVEVDGTTVGNVASTSNDPQEIIINNNGSYAFTNFAAHSVNVNGKTHSIPKSIPDNCGQNCTNLLAMNQNATHYIVGDYRPVGGKGPVWDFDGRQIKLNGVVEGLEFNGSTLYAYKWSH